MQPAAALLLQGDGAQGGWVLACHAQCRAGEKAAFCPGTGVFVRGSAQKAHVWGGGCTITIPCACNRAES